MIIFMKQLEISDQSGNQYVKYNPYSRSFYVQSSELTSTDILGYYARLQDQDVAIKISEIDTSSNIDLSNNMVELKSGFSDIIQNEVRILGGWVEFNPVFIKYDLSGDVYNHYQHYTSDGLTKTPYFFSRVLADGNFLTRIKFTDTTPIYTLTSDTPYVDITENSNGDYTITYQSNIVELKYDIFNNFKLTCEYDDKTQIIIFTVFNVGYSWHPPLFADTSGYTNYLTCPIYTDYKTEKYIYLNPYGWLSI